MKLNVDIIWNNVLKEIKEELSSLAFSTWFQDVNLKDLKDDIAIIIVPMSIHKKHLHDNYQDLIKMLLNKITGTTFELEFFLENEFKEKRRSYKRKKKKKKKILKKTEFKQKSNLNQNYTFNNFIVGNSNKFAQAAALSVAENPGKIYNPLFIYGNSGLGKTHLMHAIGNYIVQNSNKRVLYVTSDQFRDDFVSINRKDQDGTNFNYKEFFKNKYRNIDVLIIDDIQFLGGANQTQQEFFHTFTNLYNDSKQIIVSSDRSPNDLKLLAERLRTRFCWGLTVNIGPPDFELRKEILKKNSSR